MSPVTHILVPSVVSRILVSITFSLRANEAMSDLTWQKLICAKKLTLCALQGGILFYWYRTEFEICIYINNLHFHITNAY